MSYQLIYVDNDTILSWSLPYTGGLVVCDFNDLYIGEAVASPTLKLPPADSTGTGSSMVFNNISEFYCTLQTSSGKNPTGSSGDYNIAAGQVVSVYLTDNFTTDGIWQIIPFGSGQAGINSLTAQNTDGSLVITNSNGNPNPTISSLGGTLNFNSNPSIASLLALNTQSSLGLLTLTSTNPSLTYSTTALLAGSNINISNPSGIGGNPVINLDTTLNQLSAVNIGNTTITDGAINTASTLSINQVIIDTQGDITIPRNSSVTGNSSVIGTLSVTGNSSLAGNLNVNGSFNVTGSCSFPGQVGAFVAFADTGSGCSSSITVQDNVNITSVTGSGGQYTINFVTGFADATYAAVATLQVQYGATILTPFLVYIGNKQTNSLMISCIDLQGNLLPPVGGVSVIVYSSS